MRVNARRWNESILILLTRLTNHFIVQWSCEFIPKLNSIILASCPVGYSLDRAGHGGSSRHKKDIIFAGYKFCQY